jgi:glucosyl-dolichyl phosphate glucuronosyltransferase
MSRVEADTAPIPTPQRQALCVRDRLVSVVVCSHNRSADVAQCIAALTPQLSETGVECIVVDSASDNIHKLRLERDVGADPHIKLLRVDTPGLSIARNAGIAVTSGTWVAFVDDDAIVAPDWLRQLLTVLTNAPLDVGAYGGQIVPIFPSGTIPDMGPRWKMYLSLNETTGDRDCTERFELIAANCCFRRKALEQVGGLPLGLGRVGKVLLSGEDTLLMVQMRKAGWRIRYNSSFSVGHVIPKQRLERSWVRTRAYWEGVTTIRMQRILQNPTPTTSLLKAAVTLPVLAVASMFRRASSEFDLRLWFNIGLLAETARSAQS